MLSKTHTKYIQSLQHKKFRDESKLFIAEGPKVLLDLLESRKFTCKEIFGLQDWVTGNKIQVSALTGAALETVMDFELEKISALSSPNHVLAVFEKGIQNTDVPLTGKITLALDSIRDPGNLGTIIRIADWFGLTHIICSETCADMYNPKVVQSTMGSLGRVNIVYTDLVVWMKKNKEFKIYSASLNGKPVQSFGQLKEGILIIGNEAHGIGHELMPLANEKITIPKMGTAESLNAAVATGIILSHIT